MSLSPKNLSAIQKAGQAVHGAFEAIAATVQAQAQSMVASVARQPFAAESEEAIARFKTLSRLSQGLSTVEAQLQDLYAVACELANPALEVMGPPTLSKRALSNADAVDVLPKPPQAARNRRAIRTGRVIRLAKKVAAMSPGKPVQASHLTANDAKLLRYLQGVLSSEAWTAQTGAVMAAGSGLPPGSLGVSLKKLLATGAVKLGERGMYQLGVPRATTQEERGVHRTAHHAD